MFLQLFIINRAGGLIFNKVANLNERWRHTWEQGDPDRTHCLSFQDLSAAAPQLTTNDWLIMGSTFHGLHSIAAQARGHSLALIREEELDDADATAVYLQVAPVASSGIEKLECDTLKLQSFQTRTGTLMTTPIAFSHSCLGTKLDAFGGVVRDQVRPDCGAGHS